MTESIGLSFLPNPGGEAEGLNDAGVETFRDKPFAAVARETGQNSRDARAKATSPVKMTFDVLEISRAEFPDIDAYVGAAKLCLEKARRMHKEKDIGFFEQALRVLNDQKIRILKIADFNTKGVQGPCEEGKPFHSLAKADGVTDKDQVDSGGSFGIGKNAVFALSDIQTAFFSTIYRDSDDAEHPLCIGKTLFISHTGNDGEEKRRKGYWGRVDGFLPLSDPASMPPWLRRETRGTTIFSACMRKNPTDWRYEMAAALLMNFFAAIERQEMEFEIDDGFLKINRSTIRSLFMNKKVNEAVDQLKSRITFDAARTLHTALVDEATECHKMSIPDLGEIHMRILLRDGLGYTVGIVRNGMYITDNFSNFNEPLKRFPLHHDFAVIIEPVGKSEGEWFKRLEGPKHNDLSAERITDPDMRMQGEQMFTALAKKVREKIRELAKSIPSDTLELDELNEFFASEQSREEDEQGPEKDPRTFKPTPIKPTAPKTKPETTRRGDGPPHPSPQPNPDPNPDPPNPGPLGPGPTPRPRVAVETIDLQDERTVIPDRSNLRQRRILFTPPVSGYIYVSIEATGLSEPDGICLLSADKGQIEGGVVLLPCEEGKRIDLTVEFEAEYAGAIELSAYRKEEEKEQAHEAK